MSLRPILPLCIALLASLAPLAQAQDPLKSPECTNALAQLEAARAAKAGNVDSLRRTASATCLGSSAVPARPSRVVREPIRVPPPTIEARPRVPLPSGPTPIPGPLAIEREPTISSCDAAGCWVNGSRGLQHVMPNRMQAAGLCGLAPGAAGCP